MEERRDRFTSEIGGAVHATVSDGLKARPDLAFVCSPSVFHVEHALQCARAGCHLFIEKPLGTSRTGVDELIATVERNGLYAHVGSNWKFHAAFQTMKRIIDSGALGVITGAQLLAGQWLPDWHPWEDYRLGYSARRALGGGIVFDSHELDYLTWLLGPASDVMGLTAHSGALETETDDVACACLRLKSGALATIHMDYIQRQPRRRYHISGSGGILEWDLNDGRVRHFRSDVAEPNNIMTPLGDVNQMYIDQTRAVIAGITAGEPPLTPLTHAAHVLDLQLAVASGHA